MERGAWSVEQGAWSRERGAESVELGAWSTAEITVILKMLSKNYNKRLHAKFAKLSQR